MAIREYATKTAGVLAAVALGLSARADFVLEGDANSTTSAVGADDVITFTQSGTLTVTGSGTVDVLLVGGGGGGGSHKATDGNISGGGGGGGGVVYTNSFAVTAGTYNIVVGAGGVGGGKPSDNTKVDGTNGGNTTAFGFTAYGGGGGAAWGGRVGLSGGSGGGSTSVWDNLVEGGTAIHAQDGNIGYDGKPAEHAYAPGGGGGASNSSTVDSERAGKDGIAIDITGESVYYAGGGAGVSYTRTTAGGLGGGGNKGEKGTDGLGGGGASGCDGGSGIAIIRYTPQFSDSSSFSISGDVNAEELTLHDGNALVFRQNGTLTVTGAGIVDILAVGGGGGGGATNAAGEVATGGGAGGLVYKQSVAVHAGTFSIVVGAGGAIGANGGNSSVLGITAYGGGAGAKSGGNHPGNPGGSGGGAAHSWGEDASTTMSGGEAAYASSDNHGSAGGSSYSYYGCGGGGGAGSSPIYRDKDGETIEIGAENDRGSYPQWGGDGLAIDITGRSVYYAGGGAAFRSGYSRPSGGKGGGGGYNENGTDGLGGGGSGNHRGGSGVVIVRLRRKASPIAHEPATGGSVIRVGGGYRAHRFTQNGTLVVPKNIVADVLLVGGGGGGGSHKATDGSISGGGGGAGGLVYKTNIVIAAGTYDVVIGAGGVGGGKPSDNTKVDGTNGGNSTAFGFTAYGGGGGAAWGGRVGHSGGSAGGSTSVWDERVEGGTAIHAEDGNIGNDGMPATHAYAPGGGGGASNSTTVDSTRAGKNGIAIDITGESVYYAGGGAGVSYTRTTAGGLGGGGNKGEKGTDGLGGGGASGCNGGSGVVIIRYRYEAGTFIFVK